MALPELVRKLAEHRMDAFCRGRIQPEHRDEIQLEHEFRGNSVTLVERRPLWHGPPDSEWTRMKIAQLRFDPDKRTWSLYWADLPSEDAT